MVCLDLFHASISKMCLKVSEKAKRAHKGVTLYVKLDVIKCIWYNLVGYFMGMCKNIFFYKLVVIAFSLYNILVYERFQKNTLLSSSRENLYIINLSFQVIGGKIDYSVNGIVIIG